MVMNNEGKPLKHVQSTCSHGKRETSLSTSQTSCQVRRQDASLTPVKTRRSGGWGDASKIEPISIRDRE
jgi:hypothetical protein